MKISYLLFAGLLFAVSLPTYAENFIVELRRESNDSTTTQTDNPHVNQYYTGANTANGPVTILKNTEGTNSTITLQFTASDGQFWSTNNNFVSDFNNEAALAELKATFGEFPQDTMLAKVTSGGQANTVHTIKLGGFTPNTGVTVYMFLSSLGQNPTAEPTVTGGTGSFSFATNTGSGFENTFQFSELNRLTLVKWEGEVTSTELTFQTGGQKTGMSALFLHVVPEPATVALSLFGLGGLFVRRRRA